MKLNEIQNLIEGVGKFTIKKIGSETEKGDPENYEPDVTTTEYDIMLDGKKVGELTRDDYFGYVRGHLFNKHLPELSGYGRNKDSGPLSNLHGFMKSKTGKRWMSNIEKYKGLKGPTNDYRIKQ